MVFVLVLFLFQAVPKIALTEILRKYNPDFGAQLVQKSAFRFAPGC